MIKQTNFEVAVIGGGPAGMMAAGRAAELGAKVVLIEKNQGLGQKLLMTGAGRCNLCQAEFNNRLFTEKIEPNGQFLLSPLSVFGPKETIDFFNQQGLKTKTERGQRVFPVSDKAKDVLALFLKYLDRHQVKILLGQKVVGFNFKKRKIDSLKLKKGEIKADQYVLASGGKSYPKTGSDGWAYQWLAKMGHQIIEPHPALTPLETTETWPKELQGLSLKNVKLTVLQNNQKKDWRFGEMLFTHFGLSGPIVLDLSKKIGQLLIQGQVVLRIDLKPALDFKTLDKRLQRDFKNNKDFKNYLPSLLPKKMAKLILELTQINPDKKINSITKTERKKIIDTLKGLDLTVKRLVGFNSAIITSGGVSLKEIEAKTMGSKIIENLYLAGELIDLDGPTGGYNLQICWTTGYLAGTAASGKG